MIHLFHASRFLQLCLSISLSIFTLKIAKATAIFVPMAVL